MKVLVVGGVKTKNITDAIENAFNKGSIDCIDKTTVDDARIFFKNGESCDRVIVMQQALDDDGSITSEKLVRDNISKLVEIYKANGLKTETIVVCQQEEYIESIMEETFGLGRRCLTIHHTDRAFKIAFFKKLITMELEDIYETMGVKEERPQEIEQLDANENTGIDEENAVEYQEESWTCGEGDIEEVPEYEEKSEESTEEKEELLPNDGFSTNMDFDYEGQDTEKSEDSDEIDTDELEEMDGDTELEEVDDKYDEELPGIPVDLDGELYPTASEELFSDELYEKAEEEVVNPTFDIGKMIEADQEEEVKEKEVKTAKIIADFEESAYSDEKEYGGDAKLAKELKNISKRGYSMVVTGGRNSGVSTTAYLIAKTIADMGFSVLLVDLVTNRNSQAIINKNVYEYIHSSTDIRNSSIKALRSPDKIDECISIADTGLHVLTSSLDSVETDVDAILTPNEMNKFMSVTRLAYQFVIIDCDVKSLSKCLLNTLYSQDEIVVTVEDSTKGYVNILQTLGRIDSDIAADEVFSRGKLVVTKVNKQTTKRLGKRHRGLNSVIKQVDAIAEDLTGEYTEFKVSQLTIAGGIPFSNNYDDMWIGTGKEPTGIIEAVKKILYSIISR